MKRQLLIEVDSVQIREMLSELFTGIRGKRRELFAEKLALEIENESKAESRVKNE